MPPGSGRHCSDDSSPAGKADFFGGSMDQRSPNVPPWVTSRGGWELIPTPKPLVGALGQQGGNGGGAAPCPCSRGERGAALLTQKATGGEGADGKQKLPMWPCPQEMTLGIVTQSPKGTRGWGGTENRLLLPLQKLGICCAVCTAVKKTVPTFAGVLLPILPSFPLVAFSSEPWT